MTQKLEMKEDKEVTKVQKINPLGGGPLGYGDPDDRSLRKTEKDVLIPKMIIEEAEKKCSEAYKAFLNCAKNAGILVTLKCKEENNARIECLSIWAKNPDFVKEITDKYLEARSHFRRTGETKIKYIRIQNKEVKT